MKAAVLEAFREPIVVRDVPDPELLDDTAAVVRVAACGVCRSDWHLWAGDLTWVGLRVRLPLIMGHEFGGVVEAVGPGVRRFKVGDRVLTPVNHACGRCDRCQTGRQNLCRRIAAPGTAYPGGYAELCRIPNADINLVALPDNVGFVEAASLGCRYATAFHGVVDRARVGAGEWVAVYGCGGVGLGAVQVARALGAGVIAVDIDPAKLELARAAGAFETINSREVDPVKRIGEITRGGADVSIDALGIAVTAQNSVKSVAPGGRHLQIGLTSAAEAGEVTLPLDLMVLKEITWLGSAGMPQPRYPTMLKMVADGSLKPDILVGRTISIDEVDGVVRSMGEYGTTGVVVVDRW